MTERRYLREWLTDRLARLFASPGDLQAVVNWMAAHRGRPKVVLIGSGFSRNARLASGQAGTVAERVPLWPQVNKLLREGLGYFEPTKGPSDALVVAEQYQESRGQSKFAEVLLDALRDDEIQPGPAHEALGNLNLEAIVTTNQLDTLLDKMPGEWFTVIDNTDLPVARSRASSTPANAARQIVYLHGHRSAPTGWVFSRTEYERIYERKPALVRRVQQLLCEYPLLILGYSLSDPDFHWLFSSIHREQGGFMPRALCVTVGSPPGDPERAHWRHMGMHLAHLEPPSPPGAGQRDVAQELATLINSDAEGPTPDELAAWLGNVRGPTLDATVHSRISVFEEVAGELSSDLATHEEFTSALFGVWVACMPTYVKPDKGPQSKEAHEAQEAETFPGLPQTINDVCHGQHAKALARACAEFLAKGGGSDSLGEWATAAIRWRVRNRSALALGDTFIATVHAVAESFSKTGREAPAGSAEGSMGAACRAAWKTDFAESARLYGEAADAFERRGDHIGAYWARTSRVWALSPATHGSGSDREEAWAEIRREQARTLHLRLTPSVVRELGRRDRILRGALKKSLDQALSQESAFSQQVSFGTGQPELHSILEEDERGAVFPGIAREPAAILLGFHRGAALDVENALELGLKYGLDDLPTLLGQQQGRDLDEQRRLDAKLSEALLEWAGKLSRTKELNHARVALIRVLPNVAHRLTCEAVTKLTSWVVQEAATTPDPTRYTTVFSSWTSSRILADSFCALLTVLPDNAGPSVLGWLTQFVSTFNDDLGPEWRFWQRCGSSVWMSIVTLRDVPLAELVRWHLAVELREPDEPMTRDFWIASLSTLVKLARDNGVMLEPRLEQRLLKQVANVESGSPEAAGLREAVGREGPSLQDEMRSAALGPPGSLVELANRVASEQLRSKNLEVVPEFAASLEGHAARVLDSAPRPSLLRSGSDWAFKLLSACLALEIGDQDKERARLMDLLHADEYAPLHALAPSILAGSWERSPFSEILWLPATPIRDLHVVWLCGNMLSLEAKRAWSQLSSQQWGYVLALAIRCIDGNDAAAAQTAAYALTNMARAVAARRTNTDQLRTDVLGAVARCSRHPNTHVRAAIASFVQPKEKLVRNDSQLQSAAALLREDHTGAVQAEARSGAAWGERGTAKATHKKTTRKAKTRGMRGSKRS